MTHYTTPEYAMAASHSWITNRTIEALFLVWCGSIFTSLTIFLVPVNHLAFGVITAVIFIVAGVGNAGIINKLFHYPLQSLTDKYPFVNEHHISMHHHTALVACDVYGACIIGLTLCYAAAVATHIPRNTPMMYFLFMILHTTADLIFGTIVHTTYYYAGSADAMAHFVMKYKKKF